jgi:histidinol dehydrogenase
VTARLRRLDAATFTRETSRQRRFAEPQLDADARRRLRDIFDRELSATEAVQAIVDDVRTRGDIAVREWTLRLDGVDVADPRVPPSAMAEAWQATAPAIRDALSTAAQRIRAFHELQRDGVRRGSDDLHLRAVPLRRAGCYTPGGRAAYPSTVLMNVLPARIAGVESVVVASPPGPGGRPHTPVLAAAHLAQADEVLSIGGAQAVAALAYGTETIAAVDTIAGPGNVFVTLAKRAVYGSVGVDGLAGPSEIIVVATDGADPAYVAADLVSQLEHDPLAWAVCITDSTPLAAAVERAFEDCASRAARSGIIAAAAGEHGVLVVCEDMEEALRLVDDFAPEHVELVGAAAESLCDRLRTAGAIFVGADSPVPMGDYIAGPNHTLPTGGAARFKGPLSVMDFIRWPSVTRLSHRQVEELGPAACVIAEAEGLHGHAASIRLRLDAGSAIVEAPVT